MLLVEWVSVRVTDYEVGRSCGGVNELTLDDGSRFESIAPRLGSESFCSSGLGSLKMPLTPHQDVDLTLEQKRAIV